MRNRLGTSEPAPFFALYRVVKKGFDRLCSVRIDISFHPSFTNHALFASRNWALRSTLAASVKAMNSNRVVSLISAGSPAEQRGPHAAGATIVHTRILF